MLHTQIVLQRKLHLSALAASCLLFGLFGLAVFPAAPNFSNALEDPVPSTTTLAMTAEDISLNLEAGVNGAFREGNPSELSVTTNNFSGYTLNIKAKSEDNDATKLVNGEYSFNSISSVSASDDFNNGNWGIKPSKVNSVDNTSFIPAPTFDGVMLDTTDEANANANVYSISLGAKADYSLPAGRYSNTFVISAVANPTPFRIAYNKNTTDEVSGIPATSIDETMDSFMTLSDNVPTRAHYTFVGWCEGDTTIVDGVDVCDGSVYQPGDNYYLDQTSDNSTTLKAMWQVYYTVELVAMNGTGATSKTVLYNTTASFTNVGPNTGYNDTDTINCTNGMSASKSGSVVTTGAITSDTVCTISFPIKTFTVQLVTTNGTGATSKTVNYNTPASFTGVNPNTGYHVPSSVTCTGDQTATLSGSTVTTGNITGDTVCTVAFAANTYTIAYAGNNNTGGSMANTTCTYGTSCTLRSNAFTRTGYTFDGWKNGNNTYTNGASVSNLTSTNNGTVTLTAQWKGNTYTVTLDRNSGSGGTGSVTATYGSAMPSITKPTRTGYTFQGYYTSASGGTQYYNASGASVRNWDKTSATTLYARWDLDIYTITYDTAGGCFNYVWACADGNDQARLPYDLRSYTVNSNTVTLRNPYRSNYIFTGWVESGSTEKKLVATIPTGSTGNKTYIATWVAAQVEPTVEAYNSSSNITVESQVEDGLQGYNVTQTANTNAWGRAKFADSVQLDWGKTMVLEFRVWMNEWDVGHESLVKFLLDANMQPVGVSNPSGNDYYGTNYIFIDGVQQNNVNMLSSYWHIVTVYATNDNSSQNPNHYKLNNFHCFGLDLTNINNNVKYLIREPKLVVY